jgi:hypothetical protein
MADYALSEVSGAGNGYTVVQDGTDVTVTLTMEPDSINAIVLFGSLPPTWNNDPIFKTSAIEGMDYSGTLATDASDLNVSDVLTYSLVSAPSWLTVASDGQLSGIPADGDTGSNAFTVRVTDAGGLYEEATLNVYVLGRYTGELGLSDLTAFAARWLDTGCGACGGADLNDDGDVDMQDWGVFSDCWLK